MNNLTCGFLGLGLIGGSIAKAIRRHFKEARLFAYDCNEDTLALAKQEQIIDEICPAIDASFAGCDYVFLCAPVSHNAENLRAIKPYLSPKTILTDVGSVKMGIHQEVESLALQAQFIGGHPMAGSERFGFLNAKASLLENAYYILTPEAAVPKERVEDFCHFIEKIGAIPLILPCAEHDHVTAAISHLPHVIASCLVNLVKDSDSEAGVMRMVAAGGFKDITRIASSSPGMWQQICLTNSENISLLLKRYIGQLNEIAKAIDAQAADALYDFFDDARQYRESFASVSSGPIKTEYVFTLDIADKPGAIAAVASLLAMHEVSIKNIGINHNREFAEGTLRIEVYDAKSHDRAVEVMTGHGYTVHIKTG